jgi:hypothetical protein
MRGWLHLLVASAATGVLASGRHATSPAPVLHFAVVTFVVPYWASACLHFVPWRKRTAHDLALALDFMGISAGTTLNPKPKTQNLNPKALNPKT